MIPTLPIEQTPMTASGASWIGLGSRTQAVECLTEAILSGSALAGLSGPSGSGKSSVVREALSRLRRLGWMAAWIQGASNGRDLVEKTLGVWERDRLTPHLSIGECWKRFEDSLKLLSIQNRRAVLGVDSCRDLTNQPDDVWVLHKLREAALMSQGALSLILVDAPWPLTTSVRLPRLTRSEAVQYLSLKYANFAGGKLSLSQAALAKLHAMSRGLPGVLDRLATSVWSLAIAEHCAFVDREWVDVREDQIDPNPVELDEAWDFESEAPLMRSLSRGENLDFNLARTW